MHRMRGVLAVVSATFGLLSEACRVSFPEISVEASPYVPKRKILLIGSPEGVSKMRDVIMPRQMNLLRVSRKEVFEFQDILAEEYGIILESDFLLDEIEKDIPKMLKEVNPAPDEFRFSKPVKRKIGRVNTTPFISQKRTHRKR